MSSTCPSFQTRDARWTQLTASSISHIKLVPACKIIIYTFSTIINNFPYGTTYKLMCQLIFYKFHCLNNQLSYQRRILAWSYLGESCTSIHCWCFKNIFLPNLLWSLTKETNWSTIIRIMFFALLNIDAASANSLSYYTVHSLIGFSKELYNHSCNFRYQHFQNWG